MMKRGFRVLLSVLLLLCLCAAAEAEVFYNAEYYTYYVNARKTYKTDDGERAADVLMMNSDGELVTETVIGKNTVAQYNQAKFVKIEKDGAGNVCTVEQVKPVCEWCYVTGVSENEISVNSAHGLNGIETVIPLAADCKVIAVPDSGADNNEVRRLDRIAAIMNEDGTCGQLYILERNTVEGYCPNCGEVVSWLNWNKDGTLPVTGGHYRLTKDDTLTGQMSIAENQKICLDLYGHTVYGANNARIYSLHNPGVELAVMDTGAAADGALIAQGSECAAQGTVLWARYGTLKIYSGTYDASQIRNNFYGAACCIDKGAAGEMYGGTLIGGECYAAKVDGGNIRGGFGGTLYVGGTFDLYDGVIRDGIAKTVDDLPYFGLGGNTYVAESGTLNVYGGEITGGKADTDGDTIYVAGTANGIE